MLETLPVSLSWNPVLEPIIHNGQPLPKTIGQKVVRDDTNEVLGIVGGRYSPKPYSLLWNSLIEGLHKSDLDLSDAEVKFNSMNNGGAMSALITLPKYNFKRIVGESTAITLKLLNSVDGSLKYEVVAGNMIIFCKNLQASLQDTISYTAMHTAGTDPAKIGQVVSTWPTLLERDAHLFKYMREVHVPRSKVQTFLEKNLCITTTKSGVKVNQKWLNKMLSLYDEYRRRLGETAYAFYNTMTHYGTHVDADSLRGADLGTRALRQEREVQRAVRSPVFKNLIHYEEFEQRHVA